MVRMSRPSFRRRFLLGFNLARQRMDVSPNQMEHSPIKRENAPMSAADDVLEMQDLVGFIADRISVSKKDKDRANALYRLFNPESHRNEAITWNRCFEFLKGKVRLVHSWEKDLARAKREAIEAADRQRRTREHIEWLQFIHQQATSDGADMDRSEIAALERVLSRVGALDSAMGNSGETRRRATD